MAVGSMGGSSSEVSATVKSDRLVMLMDGECWTGDPGIVPVSGVATGSSGEGWGFWGSRPLFGSPSDVTTGVAAGSFWSAQVGFGFPVANTGGGGRPSQPCSRRRNTS